MNCTVVKGSGALIGAGEGGVRATTDGSAAEVELGSDLVQGSVLLGIFGAFSSLCRVVLAI